MTTDPNPRPEEELLDENLDHEGPDGLDESDPDALLDDAEPGDEGGGEEDRGQEDVGGEDEGQAGRAVEVTRKRPRANEEIIKLRRRAQEAERQAQETARQVQDLQSRLTGQQSEAQKEEERQRLQLMGPDERLDYFRRKDREEVDRKFQQLGFMQADANDRNAFDRLCLKTPIYDQVAEQVETELANARRMGLNPTRQIVANAILGERLVAKASRARPRQQRQAAESRARETVRQPAGSRSDERGGQRTQSDKAARIKRLSNLEI